MIEPWARPLTGAYIPQSTCLPTGILLTTVGRTDALLVPAQIGICSLRRHSASSPATSLPYVNVWIGHARWHRDHISIETVMLWSSNVHKPDENIESYVPGSKKLVMADWNTTCTSVHTCSW